MKNKVSKRILSMLLALVMIFGLLPVMASAATYTKAGEITQITAKSTGFVTPALEGEVTLPYLTVISPKDQNIHIFSDAVFTYWERKDADGAWSKYTASVFEEGIYRLHIAMFNTALDDGSYYALSGDTALTVDGTPWTTVGIFEDYYSETGRGQLEYYSPEYLVTAPAGYYKITVTGDGNGTVSADVFYGKTGQTVTLTATPNRMYRLKQWQVVSGGVTVANDRFVMGNSAVEIRAEFESIMVNAGQIDRVEAKSQEDLRPVLGRQLNYDMEVTDPQDVNVQIRKAWTRWEKLQPDGSWKTYIDPTYTYGTYRLTVALRSEAFEDGRYYSITKNTRLFVDGVEWTMKEAPLGSSYTPEKTYGTAYYAGPVMEAIPLLTVSDSCLHCSVVPVSGDLTVPMGDDFSFTIEPDDYYELTDPTALKVYVNDELVTPDANGVYTEKNATEDVDIYCDGTAFTGYSNLIISANGKTVTEKVYVGDTYTFKTLAEFGATVPSGSTFTGWKLGGKTYQPGDTYTVVGTTDINVNAAFTGLYNVTVENGKAYADEAHTQPITHAAEEQVIYIVADPAPEGKVFSYWSRTFATVGGHGWFDNSESAETTFTVYDSDVVLAPVYEVLVDNIVINGMTKPSAGVAVDNSDYSYKWGCSVPANSGYSLGICYWYDTTTGEPVSMSNGDVFQIGHTYRFQARIHLYGDTCFPQNAEDISVALSGIDAEDYEWTINEIGYTSATIYFEFTCKRETPDTSYIRPAGDGTEGNPFQITNIGELYWFAAFVNGIASYPDGVTVEREAACAILMNDITVNPGVLADNGTLRAPAGLANWTPIGYYSSYLGTFDGQNHTISGIYCAPQSINSLRAMGFFASVGIGSRICNLTLADSFFTTYLGMRTTYAGGIVGRISNGTVENCHFNGTVADEGGEFRNRIAGIAACVINGEVRNCTVKGKLSGRGDRIGGIAADVSYGNVIGCVNEATVKNIRSSEHYTAGIVGTLGKGTVQDCYNKGAVATVADGELPAGIVYRVEDAESSVIRCWNEGDVLRGAGIVGLLNGTIQNCYNVGKVKYGILAQANSGSSVTNCHNVGEISRVIGSPICYSADAGAEIAKCYYLADSETDSVDGTTYKTADQFADGTVLALLDNGNWAQGEDDDYPVLGELPGVTMPTLTLKAPTLEFKDMITVNAFYTAENIQDVVEMGMITYSSKVSSWSVVTAEHVIPGATYEAGSGRYYSCSQGIHAKYLGDTVYLAIYAKLSDGSYAYSKLAGYSAVQYATSQLKNSTDTKLKQLVVAMLNYGAEAQLYFGHNTGSLANAALTADQKTLPEVYRADMVQSVPVASAAKQGVFANNQGFSSRKPAISFEGAFCINYFFTPEYEPSSGITLYYWNAEDYSAAEVLTAANATGKLKLEGSGTGEYRGDITGISAKNLSEAVYVAAAYKNSDTVWTSGVLGYSIGAYCSGQSSKGADVAALAEATAVYGYHAKQYFS